MNTKFRQRFDIDTLRTHVGDKVYARGEEYFRDQRVEILAVEPERVLAEVAGTEDYRIVLDGRGKRIGGECSCPAFEDQGMCKHMVATALAVNAIDTADEAGAVGAVPNIRDHLKTMSLDLLIETILEAAERDPALFRKLQKQATLAQADGKTIETLLRKDIDTATRAPHYIDYREASAWTDRVDEALDAIADLSATGRNVPVLRLAMHAIDRISAAIENIDDSDGHCRALLERARNIHLAAARDARPDPVLLARDLFAREVESDDWTFDGALLLYADVLGEKGLAEYRRLAAEAWEKLPVRSGGRTGKTEAVGPYAELMPILDFFAEREGDVDARIALRAKDLSSSWCYLRLAQFCLSNEREEQALRWTQEGLWLFEDERPDNRFISFATELLLTVGKQADALSLLRRTFEKAPSLDFYERLKKLGGRSACDEVVKFLESRLAGRQGVHWNDADVLIQILIQERAFDAAWSAVAQYRATDGRKETLANASEKSHPREAIKFYAARVDALADQGGNSAYQQAVGFVGRIASLQSEAEQANYVTQLKTRFGTKRNLMKLLQ